MNTQTLYGHLIRAPLVHGAKPTPIMNAEVPGHYEIILNSLLDAVPDGKPIMTHIGGFLDWYNRTYNTTYDFGTLDNLSPPGTRYARGAFWYVRRFKWLFGRRIFLW